jgi:hypothetical protein
MNGGSLTVGGDFQIASHDPSYQNVKATFTQTGGSVSVDSNVTLSLGDNADTTGWAIYSLLGGTLKLNNASAPFLFSNDPADIYINFEYGSPTSAAMILKGTWTYASLTAIANSDFRVHGIAATADTLRFVAGTGDLAGYTIVYGVPEPSALLLALAGLGCVGCVVRRRRLSFSNVQPGTSGTSE